jgi:quercetin dioxygenase-like cupin family protein
MSLVELDPNAVLPEHSHPQEQVGVLLEGSLRFTIGGETKELGSGGTWQILPDVPHSVTAGPEGAAVIEIFAPTRDDWRAIEEEEPRPPRWPPPTD